MVTDASYPVPSSVEVTKQSKSFLLQRTTASHLHIENEQGQTIILKGQVRGQRADSIKEIKGWVRCPRVESGRRCACRVIVYPKSKSVRHEYRKAAKLRKKHQQTSEADGGLVGSCW